MGGYRVINFIIGLVILIPLLYAIELKVQNNILKIKRNYWRDQAIKKNNILRIQNEKQ